MPSPHKIPIGKFLQECKTGKAFPTSHPVLNALDFAARFCCHFSAKNGQDRLCFDTLTRLAENFFLPRQHGTLALADAEQLGTKYVPAEGYYYSLYYSPLSVLMLSKGPQAPTPDDRHEEQAPPQEGAAIQLVTVNEAVGRLADGPPPSPPLPSPKTAIPIMLTGMLEYQPQPDRSDGRKGWPVSDGLPDGSPLAARQFSTFRE